DPTFPPRPARHPVEAPPLQSVEAPASSASQPPTPPFEFVPAESNELSIGGRVIGSLHAAQNGATSQAPHRTLRPLNFVETEVIHLLAWVNRVGSCYSRIAPMGNDSDVVCYLMRGQLANDLFVTVRSVLPAVASFMAVAHPNCAPGQSAAEVVVVEDPAAPRKRFFLHEYYTRIEWLSATRAHVQTNGATGSVEWSGSEHDVLRAELRIFPEGAPESLGMFLRLLTSLLLPARGGVLIHASGIASQGEGFVFLGESGAGKTTTARRLGGEGALRFADDMAILHLAPGQPVRVEPCRFDRGGRLPGRENRSWPLRAAYQVQKGAAVTQDFGKVKASLAVWCAAILSTTGPPGALGSLLGLASDLCRCVPPRALHISPTGPILSALAGPTPAVQPLPSSLPA